MRFWQGQRGRRVSAVRFWQEHFPNKTASSAGNCRAGERNANTRRCGPPDSCLEKRTGGECSPGITHLRQVVPLPMKAGWHSLHSPMKV